MKTETIGRKKLTFKDIIEAMRLSFVEVFKRDKRVRMSYAERFGFMGQVKTLERNAVKSVKNA